MNAESPRFTLPDVHTASAPASSAFMICPVAFPGGSPGWGWPSIYQIAFEQAQQRVERKTVFERELFAVWN
jgi:hypothetical protein